VTEPTQKPAALIEAGWHALEAGDLDHAESACNAALARAPRSVEGLTLKAAIAFSQGELDESMQICREAMTIDPDDPRPYIQAAELELYSGNDEEAIALAKSAVDRSGTEADFVDAVLIKAAAELGAELDDDARRSLAEIETCVIDEPPLLHRLGQLWLEVGEPARSRRAFQDCIRHEPSSADAHHGLGMACESLGEHQAMLDAWKKVRELDAKAPLPPWHMTGTEFEAVARATLRELPAEITSRLENVPILIEDVPPVELVQDGTDPRLLGLFSGVPLPEKSSMDQSPALDTIYLYQLNLERAVASRAELEDEIRTTLIHETAHFFGLDDDDLDDLGLG